MICPRPQLLLEIKNLTIQSSVLFTCKTLVCIYVYILYIHNNVKISRYLAIWTTDHLVLWPSRHLTIWTLDHLDIWPSIHLDNGHLTIQISDHPEVWPSRHLIIRTSDHLDIWLYGYLTFWPSVPMSCKWPFCHFWLILEVLHQSQFPNVLPDVNSHEKFMLVW